jgi:phenylpropionate dioxygenase-like ring-hydroxylating dioxygenase large terminal subunit
MEEDVIRAHTMMSILDYENNDTSIRLFQQTIFGQDKPILENQFPRKLPLDPKEEISVRADKMAIAYRKWLADSGVRYGVIPVSV